MPRPGGGEQHRRNIDALRVGGFALAVALGAVGIWLIVTSMSQKRLEIGILAGLWGLLVGAYAAFGSRHAYHPSADSPGRELAVRAPAEVERRDDATARREFQVQLEEIVHREVQSGVARELVELRAEVASLRSDLVEKVGGQIRLERIETTRLIGSDLEALQAEVRQLKARQVAGLEPIAGAESAETSFPRAEPARPAAPVTAAQLTQDPPTAPIGRAVTSPAPSASPPRSSDDPFASMPRIRPFTDFELEPVERVAANGSTTATGSDRAAQHATPDADGTSGRGRRHRSEDDSGDDVLARVLAREIT